MPQIVPPPPYGEALESDSYKQFFEILRKQVNAPVFYASTSDPGVAGVPNGTWSVWLNTTSGILKVWANNGGVLQSTTLT